MVEVWKDVVLENTGLYVGWLGLILGTIFGYVVYRTNYCAMGSISDIVNFGDYRRFRSWLLAAAVAMIGAWGVQFMGVVDLSQSIYLSTNFNWLGNIIGGLMFGIGMVFAGGCVSKNLVRAGGGDLRSLMILMVVGIFAFMTIGGLLGLVRVNIFAPVTVDLLDYGLEKQDAGSLLSLFTGTDVAQTNLMIMIVLAVALVFYCLKDKGFRSSPVHLVAGIVIGLCIIAGWFLTGLASDEMADTVVAVSSLTFVRPSGDTLEYLMRFTALGAPSFAVVTLVGTMLGGFIAAVSMARFRVVGFADVNDTKRSLSGAALMGVGGVIGLGCTVGQGLTGFSTLAIGSMITFFFIFVGGVTGIHLLNRKLMAEA